MASQKNSIALITVVILNLLCLDVFAAETTTLRAAYAAFTSNNLPLWIAKDDGMFKSQGLDVEISYGRGGSSTAQALLAKSIDVMVGSGGAVEANLAGGDLIYIASHVPTLVLTMFSKPEIKSVGDLKGKNIGTTAPASITEYAVRLTLKRYGLDPYKDIKVVHTNGMENTFAALSQGLVDAGIFSGPIVISARKAGYRELVNIASLRLPFVHEGVVVRRAYMKENKGLLERFLKGFVLGIRSTKSDKALAYKMIEKYLKFKDREAIEGAYDEIAPYFEPQPYVPKLAVQNMLSLLADQVPEAKNVPADRFYDNGLLDDLKNEGFFKRSSSGGY